MADETTNTPAAAPVFVGELPPEAPTASKRELRYDALTERPGEWAEWWGSEAGYVYKACRNVSRDGFRFEAARRNGKAYIRAVQV